MLIIHEHLIGYSPLTTVNKAPVLRNEYYGSISKKGLAQGFFKCNI
jgi:hypothetical protein